MKQLEKFFSHASIYTVLISLVWCSFSSMVKMSGISLSSYLLILSFSLILSSAEYIFTLNKINKVLQYLIHYTVLCVAFNVIFVSLRKSDPDYEFKASMVFAAIFLFSVLYAVFFLVFFFINKSKKKNQKKKTPPSKANAYKSRFK